ncbi:MAG: hydantoinase/oxoprolinase family protein [Promethearchaeota archaeon]
MKRNSEFVLSLDIGGANTKISLLFMDLDEYAANYEEDEKWHYRRMLNSLKPLISIIKYFPFWIRNKDDFKEILKEIKEDSENALINHVFEHYHKIRYIRLNNSGKYYRKLSDDEKKENEKKELSAEISENDLVQLVRNELNKPDLTKEDIFEMELFSKIHYHIAVTTTAELSDAFYTKKEGITTICNDLEEVFNKEYIMFITVNGDFIGLDESKERYMEVAASNWIATSLVFGEHERLGLLLDMGSTTLDLIPIIKGRPTTIGKNDLDRLLNNELYYTGVLRPPVSTIVKEVPYNQSLCPISFERFAIMADIYRILGKISEKDYNCDTPDGRGKSVEESYARLARIICGDINLIAKEDLDEIAKYIANQHKELIKEAIRKAIDSFIRRFIVPMQKIKFNITGLGAKIILEDALKELDIYENQIFYPKLPEKEHIISTSLCLGLVFFRRLMIERNLINE